MSDDHPSRIDRQLLAEELRELAAVLFQIGEDARTLPDQCRDRAWQARGDDAQKRAGRCVFAAVARGLLQEVPLLIDCARQHTSASGSVKDPVGFFSKLCKDVLPRWRPEAFGDIELPDALFEDLSIRHPSYEKLLKLEASQCWGRNATACRMLAVLVAGEPRQPQPPAEAPPQYRIWKDGDSWWITYEGETTPPLPDLMGIRYIFHLLRKPDQEISAVDLFRAGHADFRYGQDPGDLGASDLIEAPVGGNLGAMTDADPKQLKGARDLLVQEFDAESDPAKKAQIKEEIDFIDKYQTTTTNIRGGDRKTGDPLGNARRSISKAIGQALDKIKKHHKSLWQHLHKAIHRGGDCSYKPSTPIPWKFI